MPRWDRRWPLNTSLLALASVIAVLSAPQRTAAAVQAPGGLPEVRYAERRDTSPRLSEMAAAAQAAPPPLRPADPLPPRRFGPGDAAARRATAPDGALQLEAAPAASAFVRAADFEGVDNRNGLIPPDTNGDVGPHHYLQIVNVSFAVFDKATGTAVLGPANNNTLWAGFGGPCETTNDGDPIALYDQAADRWLVSQFANIRNAYGPYYECVAVSATGDPTGAYHRYAFKLSDTKVNDYPKLGVWPDAYYLTANQYAGGSWAGVAAAALERDRMLAGQPARMILFDLLDIDPNFFGLLPADWDGYAPPPDGAPGLFAAVDDDAAWAPADQLRLWEFHTDWNDPPASTFGINGQPNAILDTAAFASDVCGYSLNCVPQPGTSARLDGISDRLMHRLAYRNAGGYQALTVNHTVNADAPGGDRAGVRWYELRRTGEADWRIHQQGTYGPGDGLFRWMGSLAADGDGNLALGYSASSAAIYPSIRATGRLATDPPGVMTQPEAVLTAGGGSQTSNRSRWGDYSAMSVDPVDDCTFWYANQYYPVTSDRGWHTRISAFRFPDCARGTLAGTITDARGAAPVAGARAWVDAAGSAAARTGSDGVYRLGLRAGAYTLTVDAYGYTPTQVAAVVVPSGTRTIIDVALEPRPQVTVSGMVADRTTGAPLSATVTVRGSPFTPPVTWTTTGAGGRYTLTLAAGQAYTLTARAPFSRPDALALGVLWAGRAVNFRLGRQWWLLPVMRP
jgi:hypothetical protein